METCRVSIGIGTTLIRGRVEWIMSSRHQVHGIIIGQHFVIEGVRRECDWVAVHSGALDVRFLPAPR